MAAERVRKEREHCPTKFMEPIRTDPLGVPISAA